MSGLCGRRSGRPGRSAWPFRVALIAVVVLLAAACSSPGAPAPAGPATAAASTGPAKAVVPPETPAGAQLRWLIAALAVLPLSDAQARAHFDEAFLAREAALTTTGMASPALDRPFLTTREIFILKLDQWPTLARRYLAADEPSRRALLASTVDREPLVAAAGTWITPRDINSLEYFASASDICRAYASLAVLTRRPGLSPIGQLLSLNDAGLQLDPAQWQTTWFKGGSEPGVLTLAYLATSRTGHSYVVTVLAENPSQPIDESTAIPAVLSAIKGAFALAARR